MTSDVRLAIALAALDYIASIGCYHCSEEAKKALAEIEKIRGTEVDKGE